LRALVTHDTVPGRTQLWKEFQELRGNRTEEVIEASKHSGYNATGIGTPDDMRAHLTDFQNAGVDQIIFMQQSGRNRHDHICESLQLFADEVMGPFSAECEAREQAKEKELAPYLEAALARKKVMQPLADDDIPVVRASVKRVEVNRQAARD